ncbi:MAG: hypothetical protein R3250_09980 [Melioribacteraceae bacterium]|nr:hypothetical protein [Melioribacteraceae bacterium]
MRSLIFAFLIVLAHACSNNPDPVDSSSFETSSIPGSNAKLAVKKNEGGRILEHGILRNYQKDGSWIVYHDDQSIKTISTYVNGKLNGLHVELNSRGQMEFEAYYMNDEYHGLVARYNFGRPTQQLNYKNGILDGPFTEYSNRGKLKKRGSFKNGKQHGTLEFYDDNEQLIMQYEYKDGEKISGGIIEKEESTN